ncbi:hypothetical protein CI789_22960 (plasmid) [Erwinia persicina]|nr:hypothetical protein CI789_22960 [Erwinia persicina]
MLFQVYVTSEVDMNPNRKQPQKFDFLVELKDELTNAGHPPDKVWYTGEVISGKQSWTHPVAFFAADSRMIAQLRSDGTFWTLYGYDDRNDPNIPEPTDKFNLDEYLFQLMTKL